MAKNLRRGFANTALLLTDETFSTPEGDKLAALFPTLYKAAVIDFEYAPAATTNNI